MSESQIASYIKAYMKKSGASFDEVKGKLEKFQKTFRNDNTNNLASIFEVKDDTNLSVDEFEQIIKCASSTGLSEFSQDDIQMFLDLVDIDDDGYYSADELGQLAYEDNVISSQSIWNGILCGHVKEADVLTFDENGAGTTVGGDNGGTTVGGDSGGTTVGGDSGGTTVGGDDGGTTVGGDDGDITVGGDNGDTTVGADDGDTTVGGDETVPPSDGDYDYYYTDSEISELKNKIDKILSDGGDAYKCPEDVISHWIETGDINEEIADELRSEYTRYNEDDEKTITQIMNVDNLTRAEAIKVCKEKNLLKDSPISDSNTSPEVTDTSAINVDQYVEDLHDAMEGFAHTDESELKSIIINSNISDDEFVEIVKAYEKKYGLDTTDGRGLVTMLEKETSIGLQTDLTTALANRLAKAAMNGNEDAIDLICKEVYSGTAGQKCTANDFLETIFLSGVLSDDIIAKIADKYSTVNSGRDIIDDIKADYDGLGSAWGYIFGYGKGGDMISKIKEARRNN